MTRSKKALLRRIATLAFEGLAPIGLVATLIALLGTAAPTDLGSIGNQPGAESVTNSLEVATGFTEMVTALLVGAIGGIAALTYKMAELTTFTRFQVHALALSMGFFGGGIYAGYESHVAAVRTFQLELPLSFESGAYHLSSSLQVVMLLAGTLTFGAVLLSFVYSKSMWKEPNS